MTKIDLTQYLWNLVKTERDLYILSNIERKTNGYIQTLAIPKYISPVREISSTSKSGKVITCFILALIGAIIGVIIGFIGYWFSHGIIIGFFEALFGDWKFAGPGSAIGAIIGLFLGISFAKDDPKFTKETNEKRVKDHEIEIAQEEERMRKEQNIKENALEFYSTISAQLKDIKDIRNKLYSLGIIHPDYRGDIVAISFFCQSIDRGICVGLEGPDGAYKFYEQQKTMGTIISKLDNIIGHLEDIKSNQGILYDILRDSNNKISKIAHNSQLMLNYSEATAQNSEIIAYNSHITAQNTSILKWLSIYRT